MQTRRRSIRPKSPAKATHISKRISRCWTPSRLRLLFHQNRIKQSDSKALAAARRKKTNELIRRDGLVSLIVCTESQFQCTRFIRPSPTLTHIPTRKTPQKPPKRLQSTFKSVLFSVPNPKIRVFFSRRVDGANERSISQIHDPQAACSLQWLVSDSARFRSRRR